MIWKFIESGTDDVLGGGIYWCEQKKYYTYIGPCLNISGIHHRRSIRHVRTGKKTGDNIPQHQWLR